MNDDKRSACKACGGSLKVYMSHRGKAVVMCEKCGLIWAIHSPPTVERANGGRAKDGVMSAQKVLGWLSHMLAFAFLAAVVILLLTGLVRLSSDCFKYITHITTREAAK